MANNLVLAKVYDANLQKVWKLVSKSAVLENNALVRVIANAPADEVLLPKMSMDGLKDYSRANGYNAGAVALEWETRKLTMDRGEKFNLDAMDDMETMGVVHGNVLSEFQRTKVVPEIDAYRFAKIAQGSLPANRAYGVINSADGILSAINAGIVALDNAEVPAEDRVLFLTPAMLQLLKDKVGANRFYMNDDARINRKVEYFDGMEVIAVPQQRFYVGWQKDEEAGFINEGSRLNFMIVAKEAVLPVIKHNPLRVFSPEVNQSADAYQYCYRIYHDCLIAPNKEAGIYVHTVESFTPETVDTPKITVEDDNTASVKFTLKTNTTGATLYYTLDGTNPTSASTQYSSKVTVTDTTIPSSQTAEKTIKVIAIKADMLDSEIVSKKIKVVGSGT